MLDLTALPAAHALAFLPQLAGGWGALAGHLHLAVQAAPAPGGAPTNIGTTSWLNNFGSFMQFTNPQYFQQLLDNINQEGWRLGSRLLDDGGLLLNALLLLVLTWKGIRLMLDQAGMGEYMAEFFHIAFMWGIAFWFISNQNDYMTLMKQIISGFDYIAQQVSGLSYPPGQEPSALWQGAALLFFYMDAMFHQIEIDINQLGGPLAMAIRAVTGNPAIWVALVDGLFKMLIFFVMLLATIMFICVFFASQMLVFIAMALGPIFIPWLIWETTEDYFHGWLRFMLAAGMFRVMGILILGILKPVLDLLNPQDNLSTGATAFLPTVQNDLALLTVAILICFFMLQAPSWANGIMNGNAGLTALRKPSLWRLGRSGVKSGGAMLSRASKWGAARLPPKK